jgi:hypothetical protein
MAKKIEIIGVKPKTVEVLDQPKRRIEPFELAAALGANPAGQKSAEKLDLISLAELGTQLLDRLRSSGGRPALADATEVCRVPLSSQDIEILETITDRIAQTTGTKPSPGQVASAIVRRYLTTKSTEVGDRPGLEEVIPLALEIREPWLVAYFEPFTEPDRLTKALEALKVGVIALQAVCSTHKS